MRLSVPVEFGKIMIGFQALFECSKKYALDHNLK